MTGKARSRVLALVVAPIALLLTGTAYQALSVRREAIRFPPPGRLVDVGGRRLHLVCSGDGDPAVIFESSGFGSSLSFDAVRTEVGTRTRTCAYDRAGMGWSDPMPGDGSVGRLADDLRRLLEAARMRPPYVLVPASMGGLVVEMFARRHRERVAGLVFVDAADSEALERVAPRVGSLITQACLATIAARVGLLRLIDPLGLRSLDSNGAARTIALVYRVEPVAAVCGMLRGVPRSLEQFREAPPLAPDIPLIVLTHDTPGDLFTPAFRKDAEAFEPEWRDLQQRLSRRSTRGVWRTVSNSGHLIHGEQPHAVAAAVFEVLDLYRR